MSDALDHVVAQIMIANRLVPARLMGTYYARAQSDLGIDRSLDDQIGRTNLDLAKLGMRVFKARNDISGNWQYVLVNQDEPAQAATALMPTLLSHGQTLQFKKMLDAIFLSDRESYILENQVPGSSSDQEALLGLLKEDLWLEHIDSKLYPSLRVLLELRPYLEEHYAGRTLFACTGCNKWLIYGCYCQNAACRVRLHDYCYKHYFQRLQRPEGTCPECGSALEGPPVAPEPAAPESQVASLEPTHVG